jgi:hypothetical protein
MAAGPALDRLTGALHARRAGITGRIATIGVGDAIGVFTVAARPTVNITGIALAFPSCGVTALTSRAGGAIGERPFLVVDKFGGVRGGLLAIIKIVLAVGVVLPTLVDAIIEVDGIKALLLAVAIVNRVPVLIEPRLEAATPAQSCAFHASDEALYALRSRRIARHFDPS